MGITFLSTPADYVLQKWGWVFPRVCCQTLWASPLGVPETVRVSEILIKKVAFCPKRRCSCIVYQGLGRPRRGVGVVGLRSRSGSGSGQDRVVNPEILSWGWPQMCAHVRALACAQKVMHLHDVRAHHVQENQYCTNYYSYYVCICDDKLHFIQRSGIWNY